MEKVSRFNHISLKKTALVFIVNIVSLLTIKCRFFNYFSAPLIISF